MLPLAYELGWRKECVLGSELRCALGCWLEYQLEYVSANEMGC